MQIEARLRLISALAILLIAFAPPLAGQTQITVTEEYKGAIREIKPRGLFHPLSSGKGLTPEQVTTLKQIIASTDNSSLRDGLEDAILVDLYVTESYAALLNETQDYLARYPQGDRHFRPQILFYVAEALYCQEKYQDAMVRYREIMNNYSYSETYAFAQHGLAWCLMHLGRYDEARGEFKAPTTVDLLVSTFFGQAINEFNAGRYEDAIPILFDEAEYRQIGIWGDLAQQLVPKNLYYKGLAYDRLGYRSEAISCFRRVAEDFPANPKAPNATYLVGLLSFFMEDYDQAIIYLNKAKNLVSDSASLYEIRINLSQAYYNSGRLAEAIYNWKDIRSIWGPSVANTGLEQAYTRLTAQLMADEGAVTTDSLESLLENFAADLPDSKDLPTFQLELAKRFYDEANYRKVLEWAAFASSGRASEDFIKQAKVLRLYSLFQLKEWQDLVSEGESFQQQYPKDVNYEIAFLLGAGYSYRGDALKPTNTQLAQDQYRKAIPLFERFLRDAPQDNTYRSAGEQLLSYCRSQLQ